MAGGSRDAILDCVVAQTAEVLQIAMAELHNHSLDCSSVHVTRPRKNVTVE